MGVLVAGDGTLEVYVKGEQVDGDPALVKLEAHQEIAVVYGPTDRTADVPDGCELLQGTSAVTTLRQLRPE